MKRTLLTALASVAALAGLLLPTGEQAAEDRSFAGRSFDGLHRTWHLQESI